MLPPLALLLRLYSPCVLLVGSHALLDVLPVSLGLFVFQAVVPVAFSHLVHDGLHLVVPLFQLLRPQLVASFDRLNFIKNCSRSFCFFLLLMLQTPPFLQFVSFDYFLDCNFLLSLASLFFLILLFNFLLKFAELLFFLFSLAAQLPLLLSIRLLQHGVSHSSCV